MFEKSIKTNDIELINKTFDKCDIIFKDKYSVYDDYNYEESYDYHKLFLYIVIFILLFIY